MYQAERTRPLWARIYMLGILTRRVARLSDGCQFAVTQFRSRRGGSGCRGLVAVDAPDQFRTLCRSPRKKRRERRFPEACRPSLANASPKRVEVYQNPRRWGSGKCCQCGSVANPNVASFQLGRGGDAPPGRRLSQLAVARERGPPAARNAGITAAVRLRCGPPRASAVFPLRPSGGRVVR